MAQRRLTGSGRISVVDNESNQPSPGALISLITMQGSMGMSMKDDSLRTNAEGVFVLKSLSAEGNYVVSVSAAGYANLQSPLRIAPGEETSLFASLFKADSFFTGVAIDMNGDPMVGVRVSTNSRLSGNHSTTTNEAGQFRIEQLVKNDQQNISVIDGSRAVIRVMAMPGESDLVLISLPPTTAPK